MLSDLAKGTGHFTLLQGVIQAALGAGAFLSNPLAGLIASSSDIPPAFFGTTVLTGRPSCLASAFGVMVRQAALQGFRHNVADRKKLVEIIRF